MKISPSLDPNRNSLDFEETPNEFNAKGLCKFPLGYYHLWQSFNKKSNEMYSENLYENNPEMPLTLRYLPALSLESAGRVRATLFWS